MNSLIEEQLPLKEKAYKLIKDKIIECELVPGSNISEAQIAEELGISRTPVREALLRLNQEKFVVIYPRKGIIVSPITVKDIHEVFQIREIIEPQIGKIAFKNMSEEYLINLKEKFKNANFDPRNSSRREYFHMDAEFHKYIVQSGNNEHLIRFSNEIYDLDYRIRVMSTLETADIDKRSTPEHIAIIDALISRNPDKIEKTIREHVESARKAALLRIY